MKISAFSCGDIVVDEQLVGKVPPVGELSYGAVPPPLMCRSVKTI